MLKVGDRGRKINVETKMIIRSPIHIETARSVSPIHIETDRSVIWQFCQTRKYRNRKGNRKGHVSNSHI